MGNCWSTVKLRNRQKLPFSDIEMPSTGAAVSQEHVSPHAPSIEKKSSQCHHSPRGLSESYSSRIHSGSCGNLNDNCPRPYSLPMEENNESSSKKMGFQNRRRLSLGDTAFESKEETIDSVSPPLPDDTARGSLYFGPGLNEMGVNRFLRSNSGTPRDWHKPTNVSSTVTNEDFGFTEIENSISMQSCDVGGINVDDNDCRGSPRNSEKNDDPAVMNYSSRRRRLSVQGQPSERYQNDFESKNVRHKGDIQRSSQLAHLGIAYACKKGLKPESPNQDDFFIIRFDEWGCYGVFDGHGPFGGHVSNFVQRELPLALHNSPFFKNDPGRALREAFSTVQKQLHTHAQLLGYDFRISGTTATVVLHIPRKRKIYVAHVGDSRAIMGIRKDETECLVASPITVDHKPEKPDEKARIEEHGGEVKKSVDEIPFRVFVKNRPFPGLAMSRALGDFLAIHAGVIAEPDVTEIDLKENEQECVLICSDGVWEFISDDEAIRIVSSFGVWQAHKAVELIAEEAWDRWIDEEEFVVDDITAVLVYLNPASSATTTSKPN